MNTYEVVVSINGTTIYAQVTATDLYRAQLIAEAQYGKGNVLSVRDVTVRSAWD